MVISSCVISNQHKVCFEPPTSIFSLSFYSHNQSMHKNCNTTDTTSIISKETNINRLFQMRNYSTVFSNNYYFWCDYLFHFLCLKHLYHLRGTLYESVCDYLVSLPYKNPIQQSYSKLDWWFHLVLTPLIDGEYQQIQSANLANYLHLFWMLLQLKSPTPVVLLTFAFLSFFSFAKVLTIFYNLSSDSSSL